MFVLIEIFCVMMSDLEGGKYFFYYFELSNFYVVNVIFRALFLFSE